ncbi:CT392 family protein [Chlamydia sp. 17-3921]|uniref:CT392 family protein n=1 Tax=Chlamydia sp. 17-3921 TaxID=2675798 RepID=UPI00191838B9|nr:hypothetical protein [Chlamydia sp. 17-3921]
MSAINPNPNPPPAGEPNPNESTGAADEAPAVQQPPILLPSPNVQKLLDQRAKALSEKSGQLGSAMSSVISPEELQSMVQQVTSGENDVDLSKEQLEQAEKGAEEIYIVLKDSHSLSTGFCNEFNILMQSREQELEAGAFPRAHAPEYIAGLRYAANTHRALLEVMENCLDVLGKSMEELDSLRKILGNRSPGELDTIYQDSGQSLERLEKLGLIYIDGSWEIGNRGLLPGLKRQAEKMKVTLEEAPVPSDSDITNLEMRLDEIRSPSACNRILDQIFKALSRLLQLLNRLYDRLVLSFFFLLKRLGLISGGPRPMAGVVNPDAASGETFTHVQKGSKKSVSDRSDLTEEDKIRRPDEGSSETQEDPSKRN